MDEMEAMSFDEFADKLKDSSKEDLKAMAGEIGLDVPPNILRETLLKRVFEAADIPKKEETTPVETPDKPAKPNPPAVSPRVVYLVSLRAQQARFRGGCKWKVGTTEVPEKKMSRATLKALNGDKDFKVQKAELK